MTLIPVVTFIVGFGGGMGVTLLVRDLLHKGGNTDNPTLFARLLGLAILASVGYTAFSTYQVSSCQTERNAEFERGLKARAASSQAANDADLRYLDVTDRFLAVIGTPGASQEAKTAAFEEWRQSIRDKREAITEINKVRDANPIVPTTSCAGG